MAVQWPRRPVSVDGADVLPPLRELLLALNLVEKRTTGAADTDEQDIRGSGSATPWSEQAVTAGTLALTKVITAVVGTAGVAGGAVSGIAGYSVEDTGSRIAAISGAAVIITGTVVALAAMVRADVAGRALSSAAQYEARARVAAVFLEKAQPVPSSRYFVLPRNAADWVEVTGFEMHGAGRGSTVCARTVDGDHVLVKDVANLTTVDAGVRP